MPLTESEWASLEAACSRVPPPKTPPAVGTDADYPDYITNLFLTVLDLQLRNVIVNNAILFYRANRWEEVRTLDDLDQVLSRFPESEGNQDAAEYLWGYRYGDRLGRLRNLARWARRTGVTDQDHLKAWAHASRFEEDFAGQIKGLGISAYCWLVMRLGVDTVKPDIWVHSFVTAALGRSLSDEEVVDVVTEAARRVGRNARELDLAIWESERGAPGSI